MSQRRPIEVKQKKERSAIKLEIKYNIIKCHAAGTKVKDLATRYKLNTSTVSTILKSKEQYLNEVKCARPMQTTRTRKDESGLIHNVEKLLNWWIVDQAQRFNMTITQTAITNKALEFFNLLKQRISESANEKTFRASNGWFNRFKRRSGWHNPCVKVQKEANNFPRKLSEIIEEEGFNPALTFNVDESELFWKRMPARTQIAQDELTKSGFKVANDRVTLLFGGNALGDLKLKPMLVYRAENPRALKNIDKTSLPVIWKSNERVWMTPALFEDWFLNNFVPEVRNYCKVKNIKFHALLLIDHAPGHAQRLQYLHPNVKIIFLPPNTTSKIQPMNQGVMEMFKARYIRYIFEMLIEQVDRENGTTLNEYWKQFNIFQAIKIIDRSWENITKNDMEDVWKKLSPKFEIDCKDFVKPMQVKEDVEIVFSIANQLNLRVSVDDVEELLDMQGEELTNEDLIELHELANNTYQCETFIQQEQCNEVDQCDTGTFIQPEQSNEVDQWNKFIKPEQSNEVDQWNTFIQPEQSNEVDQWNAFIQPEQSNEVKERSFYLKDLNEGFKLLEQAIQVFQTQDPNLERSAKVNALCMNTISCYRAINKEQQKSETKKTFKTEEPFFV